MAIRHPSIASKFILADCGAAFSEPGREAFRNMAAAPKAKGLAAITDVAMRRLFAPEFQAAHPDLMRDRREAFLKTDPEVLQAACAQLAELDLRPELPKVKMPVLVLVGEHDEATPPPMSHELAALLPDARLKILEAAHMCRNCRRREAFLERDRGFSDRGPRARLRSVQARLRSGFRGRLDHRQLFGRDEIERLERALGAGQDHGALAGRHEARGKRARFLLRYSAFDKQRSELLAPAAQDLGRTRPQLFGIRRPPSPRRRRIRPKNPIAPAPNATATEILPRPRAPVCRTGDRARRAPGCRHAPARPAPVRPCRRENDDRASRAARRRLPGFR